MPLKKMLDEHTCSWFRSRHLSLAGANLYWRFEHVHRVSFACAAVVWFLRRATDGGYGDLDGDGIRWVEAGMSI